MFDSIAKDYDSLNHVLSLSIDKSWRRKAINKIIDAGENPDILDVACGTGDFSISIAKAIGKCHITLRVLKPGGRLVILELSMPENKVIRWFYDIYFLRILPVIGGKVSGDKTAYAYLPASVKAFPRKNEFMEQMRNAGFKNVTHKSFSFGICRMYCGEKE